MTNYILKDKKPVPCADITEWAKWFEDNKGRIVKQTRLPGEVLVSTVFLGIDHRICGYGDPILFETMIFGGNQDDYQIRCSTWEQAEEQHEEAVKIAQGENR